MATREALPPAQLHRIAIRTALLVGLAVLLVTQDPRGIGPYIALALALFVALHGYARSRSRRP